MQPAARQGVRSACGQLRAQLQLGAVKLGVHRFWACGPACGQCPPTGQPCRKYSTLTVWYGSGRAHICSCAAREARRSSACAARLSVPAGAALSAAKSVSCVRRAQALFKWSFALLAAMRHSQAFCAPAGRGGRGAPRRRGMSPGRGPAQGARHAQGAGTRYMQAFRTVPSVALNAQGSMAGPPPSCFIAPYFTQGNEKRPRQKTKENRKIF